MPHPPATADARIAHATGRAAAVSTAGVTTITTTGTGTTGPGMWMRARS